MMKSVDWVETNDHPQEGRTTPQNGRSTPQNGRTTPRKVGPHPGGQDHPQEGSTIFLKYFNINFSFSFPLHLKEACHSGFLAFSNVPLLTIRLSVVV